MNTSEIKDQSIRLYAWAKERDFAGWDPYEGLNSRLFQATPFSHVRICRLAWIQFFKHCPINLRPPFLVPKGRNLKGIALFALTALNLYKSTGEKQYLNDALDLFDWLKINYSKGYSGPAWGYNFPWQSRVGLKPAFSPAIVATSFIAMSFLDGYDTTGDASYLEVARCSASFILNDLNIYREGTATSYSYGPNDKSVVYNATALGAHFIARLSKATGDKTFYTVARNAMDFVASRQQQNGSWRYGDHDVHQWIDNFHTGFNLMALKQFQNSTGDSTLREP